MGNHIVLTAFIPGEIAADTEIAFYVPVACNFREVATCCNIEDPSTTFGLSVSGVGTLVEDGSPVGAERVFEVVTCYDMDGDLKVEPKGSPRLEAGAVILCAIDIDGEVQQDPVIAVDLIIQITLEQ